MTISQQYVTVLQDRYGFSAVYRDVQNPDLDEESTTYTTYEDASKDGETWATEVNVPFVPFRP